MTCFGQWTSSPDLKRCHIFCHIFSVPLESLGNSASSVSASEGTHVNRAELDLQRGATLSGQQLKPADLQSAHIALLFFSFLSSLSKLNDLSISRGIQKFHCPLIFCDLSVAFVSLAQSSFSATAVFCFSFYLL